MKTVFKHNSYAIHTFTLSRLEKKSSVNFSNIVQDYQVLRILMNSNMTQICQPNQQRTWGIIQSAVSA